MKAEAPDCRHLWLDSPSASFAKVERLDLPGGFRAVHGGHLSSVQVAYETWGELNAAADNAVLVVHLMTSDTHVTGEYMEQPRGWWEAIVGPGRAIDTDRHFVICPNIIGGCHGTTGPRFPAPDGRPYNERFPLLTPLDMMRVQQIFLRQLGIRRLRAVVGASMGGMVAWEWAIEGGEAVDLVAVIAAPLRTSAYQSALNWLQRRGVELDLGSDEEAARWGQMIARGVGMVSYRSPVGLEERFGREWFRRPGPLLADRGMFNVESWLRHHGRRNVQRFDPYTYILFSRAMDLHDTGEDRGGVIAALDCVRCRVLVVGISSDHLYPVPEVHLGADILNNLGKPVEYAEIRSPHGHDAFLLETSQLGSILAGAQGRPPKPLVPAMAREARHVRVAVIGAGKVAARFLRLLEERAEQILEERRLSIEVVGVADIDPARRFDPVFDRIGIDFDPARLVNRDDVDVVLEVTRGTGSLPIVEAALRRRLPVVTTNKRLVRQSGRELERLALEHGVRLAYPNAIAAGWPLLHAVERPLGYGNVAAVRAVLSAACNVVLERMEQAYSFRAALSYAQSLGITEPEPELDYSGWDTAQKLTMLMARAEGRRYLADDLAIVGITDIDPVIVRDAPRLGLRVKLTGLYDRTSEGVVAGVQPLAVPADGHLGGVRGDDNVIVMEGRDTGEMVYLGRGAGSLPVASAALNDLMGLFDPSLSWTGRYPRADVPVQAPRFSHFLSREAGVTAITDTPAAGAVPLLEPLR